MNKIFETPISFLKPETLIRAEEAYANRKIDLESLREIQDKEITSLVTKEKAVGLDIITDGAFRNLVGLRDFWIWLQGVTPTVVTSGHVYQNQNSGEVIPRVTSKIDHNPKHNILNNFSFLQGNVGENTLVRVDIPAPSHFLVELLRNGWYDTTVYPSIDELAKDIYSAYRDTLRDLYDQGCRRILLIDPSWGRLCDDYASSRLVQGGIDLTKLPLYMLWANQDAIAELPEDMHIILYTPFEGAIEEECADIIQILVSHARVDSFMFDWPAKDKGILGYISNVPSGKDVILGISDPTQSQVEDFEDIKAVIDKVSAANTHIGVRISTKGGYVNNTDSIDFSSVTETDQWSKIGNLLKMG